MNKKQAIEDFKEYYLPLIVKMYERDGVPDYIARTEEWNCYTDRLCKDGQITLEQYESWIPPYFC